MSKKIIVALGTPKYKVGTNFVVHGIGDVLHGIIRTYRYAKNLGLSCYIHLQSHPIHQLLLCPNIFSWPDIKKEIPDCVSKVGSTVNLENEQHLLELLKTSSCIFSVHEYCHNPWSDDEIKLLQFIMRPKLSYTIPNKDYIVWHVRLGDSEMVHGKSLNNRFLQLELWYKNNKKDTNCWILVSDSAKFKIYISQRIPELKISTECPRHTGFHTNASLQDYFTIANAKETYTWTIHTFGCPSKFAQTAALVGNSKLIEIKL